MENIDEWKAQILADGVIDAEEVKIIRNLLFADGIIDREEVDFLLDLNSATRESKNDPTWYDLLVESILIHLDVIDAQQKNIAKLNEDITSSIKYAKRIQDAIMPNGEEIDLVLKDYFILYKPLDIVSGDFYWMDKINKTIYVAVADCTGHGVPGAFMSMLGISLLNIIVKETKNLTPNQILNRLRESIMAMLSQNVKRSETKDGMDIALCSIDLDTHRLQFAGAYNPLCLFRNGTLFELKADRMPVGVHTHELNMFSNQEMDVLPGDMIYMFSDGYPSQFGGPCDQKYMTKNLKNFLAEISNKDLKTQHTLLEQNLTEWQGNCHQVDDILVLGFKVP